MPYAITLRLDDASADQVRHVLTALADVADDVLQLGYAPHLTLAVYPEASDPAMLQAALRRIRWPSQPIAFPALGVFPGSPAVLWLAATPSAELLRRQAELVAAAPGADAYYQPGKWMPHVTLAQELADTHAAGAALAALSQAWRPISGHLNRIDLLHFRPVEIISTRALAD